MFLSPKDLLQHKIITFTTLSLPTIESTYVQQNGIDIDCLTVTDLSTFVSIPTIDVSSSTIPVASPLAPSGGYFNLIKGNSYTFTSNFSVNIPAGMCGWVIGRSSLNRCGVLVRSSLYDTGFNGGIGATIYCQSNINIQVGARVGQFVMCAAKHASLYEGQYQNK
jgi:dUTP pyrophosphatase